MVLISNANVILGKQTELMNEWSREFAKVFSKENRDQFPANRETLKSNTPKLIAMLDEMIRMGNEAIAKYEEADPLISKEQDKKGFALLAESFKKELEMYELFKTQAQLVSDSSINDAKTLNEKYDHLTTLIHQKSEEREAKFQEGRDLLRPQ